MKHLKLLLLAFVVAFTFACADDGTNSSDNTTTGGNPPTLTLDKAGVDVGFDNPISIEKDDITLPSEQYAINLKSTATGGISNLFVTIRSDNESLEQIITTLEKGQGHIDLTDESIASALQFLQITLPTIKGSNDDIQIIVNQLLGIFVSNIVEDTEITMAMRLVDANGEASETLTTNITVTPVIPAPVMSLSKAGVPADFTNEITVGRNDLGLPAEQYSINLKSTATGGITNMFTTITTDNTTLNNSLAGVLGNTPLDLANDTVIAALQALGVTLPTIAGEDNVTLSVNTLLGLLSNMIVESTKVTMALSLVDANSSDNETLVMNITVPVISSDAPVISLSKAGTPADFANEITLSKDDIRTQSEQYLLNLKSTATDGITDVNIGISTDNTTLNTTLAAYSSLDLTDSTNLVVAGLISDSIIQANIAGATDSTIFVNGLLNKLKDSIVTDTKITITLSLEDANGTDSETLVINITVPVAGNPPVISMSRNNTNVSLSSGATVIYEAPDITSSDYTVNLASNATDGITNFHLTLASTDATLSGVFSGFGTFDLANIDPNAALVAGQLVPNYASIDGGSDVNISLNTLVGNLLSALSDSFTSSLLGLPAPYTVTADTPITITMTLVDANGSSPQETLAITIDVP